MKKSRYSEEQVIGILREGESGTPVKTVCAKHNISEQPHRISFYEDRHLSNTRWNNGVLSSNGFSIRSAISCSTLFTASFSLS